MYLLKSIKGMGYIIYRSSWGRKVYSYRNDIKTGCKDQGLISFHGKKELEKWNSKELAKHLAILTQSNQIQMKLTVEELVTFGRFPHCGGRLSGEDEGKK